MRIKEIIIENQSFQFRFLPVVIGDNGNYDTKEFEEPLDSICGACNGRKQDVDSDICEPCKGKGTVSTNVLRTPVAIVNRGTLEFTEKFFKREWEKDNLIKPHDFFKIKTKLIELNDDVIKPYERNAENKIISGKMTRLPDESGIAKIGKEPDTYIYVPAITKNNILTFKDDFIKVLNFAQDKNFNREKKNVGIAVEGL